MDIQRRRFLKQSASIIAGGAAGIAMPGIVRAAQPWGQLPPSADSFGQYKILEVFLPGGASMWENFWVSYDGAGGAANWRGLDDFVQNLVWSACNGAPPSSISTQEFGEDAGGTRIDWGPATAPLWRQDIFDRARMVVTSHADQLHAFAGHRALTGRPFGSPRGASLGSAIQRHHQSMSGGQDIPFSYALVSKHVGRPYFLTYATSIGQHPGPSRPLGLKVGNPIGDLLQRQGTSAKGDALYSRLSDQYRDLLRWQGAGDIIRSSDFVSYDAAARYLLNAQKLDDLLGGDALAGESYPPCVSDPNENHAFGSLSNPTRRSFEVAAELLSSGARHVTVIDGGFNHSLLQDSSTPYDAHSGSASDRENQNVVEITSAHLFNVCQSLAGIIDSSGGGSLSGMAVGAINSGPKINLDDTLIRIHTEFNRTPNPGINTNDEGYSYAGRNHYPEANVEVLIGGPVAGRGITGGIGLDEGSPTTAIAIDPLKPTDVHAGTLYAAGVDPLAPDNFTVGDDFSPAINPGGATYAEELRSNLKNKVLGAKSDPGSVFAWG